MSGLSAILCCMVLGQEPVDRPAREVGCARVDVTPTESIRLSGYAARGSPTATIAARLHARAMAISDGRSGDPALVIAVDSIGIPGHVREELAVRLAERAGIDPARLTLLSTHSHTAPQLTGQLENIFGMPIAAEEAAVIERYTRELVDRLEEAALAALAARTPAHLSFARGSAGFAANRRTSGGPVDRSVPLLVARNVQGELLGVLASYACHCTTLGAETNEVCGDWAGFAAGEVEAAHPGAVALIGIGCGADANPEPRAGMELSRAHGHELAREIERLLGAPQRAIVGTLGTRVEVIDLAWDALPSRAEWEARAQQANAIGHNARLQLARLERGEDIGRALAYPVGVWHFGDDLALVFLAGEVVVDYSIRLARELDGERAWVFGYANDLCCYIPSRRILAEGGYEAEGAMTYYARPGRLAPEVEDRIVSKVRELLPETFLGKGERPRPLSPEEARAHFVLADPTLDVELVAAEPAILDPVAIDFDLAGRVWVAEMRDYPSGMDGALKPGGVIRCLEDEDQDGFYETSTIFLNDVPFPTGVAVYRDGLLVAAAPDLLFARDTDGDRVADEVKTLFTGFPTHNEQARLNSLQLGLDGWWYAASGLFGGPILRADGSVACDTSGRDFRFRPDTLELEPVAGLSQHGRIRDDFGEWFGCDSGTLAWHFPLREEVLARNPYVLPPSPRVSIATEPDATRVFPVATFVERFNEPESVGRLTAGCGNTFYRDVALGEEYAGDMFVCEPAYNLVTRLELEHTGTTFTARRAPRERDREFLASSDPWFRPVQAITAPDGSLWILDMYRRVIEHPRWIPPDRLAELDVRAGEDKGRIWRVVRRGEGKALPRLDSLPPAYLARRLDTTNGVLRDHVFERLLAMDDCREWEAVRDVLERGTSEAARVSAFAALEELGGLRWRDIHLALTTTLPRLRRAGVEMASRPEYLFMEGDQLAPLIEDADAGVRLEVASNLGLRKDRASDEALAKLLLMEPADPYIEAACLAGAPLHLEALCAAALRAPQASESILRSLASTAAGMRDAAPVIAWLESLLTDEAGVLERRIHSAASLFAALEASGWDWRSESTIEKAVFDLGPFFARALAVARDPDASVISRCEALEVFAFDGTSSEFLGRFVTPDAPPELAAVAVDLIQRGDEEAGKYVLMDLVRKVGPSLRSRIVSAMLSRESWTIEALENADPVIAAAFDLSQRQRLHSHQSEAVRALAEKAFGERPSPSRALQATLLLRKLHGTGDAALGKEVFAQQCAKCHRLDGVGTAVGPDLAALTDRSDEALLQAILDPNRAVLDAYLVHVLEIYGGEQYEGIVSEETATGLVLIGSDGVPRRILRAEIASIRPTRTSLMPDGFELLIGDADFANLLAFLRLPREARKVMAGNEPLRIAPANDGTLLLEARTAEVYGQGLVFEAPFQNLGYWHGPLDRAEWVVEVPESGDYDVRIEWACAPDAAGNPWVLEVAGQRLEGIVPSTGGWDRYETAQLGTLHFETGERRVILRPGREPEWALMDLRSVTLVRR